MTTIFLNLLLIYQSLSQIDSNPRLHDAISLNYDNT